MELKAERYSVLLIICILGKEINDIDSNVDDSDNGKKYCIYYQF